MFCPDKVKDELILWIKDYFEKNATNNTYAIIGISGGKDSSVCASLCVKALGKERVIGVLLPNGVQKDINYSEKLCKFLDIKHITLNINKTVNSIYENIENESLTLTTVTTFNTPARVRMTYLYAISGVYGGRVVNTCNLSEDYVGYSTKFGDQAGDFSPLSELTVTEVKQIGYALNLPKEFIEKVPEDGLSMKTDEENLGFSYEVLDKYIRSGICEDIDIKNKIDRLHKMNLHKITPMPKYEKI